jgi:RHS repeat-associated protein
VAGATYNAADHQLTFGSTPLTYDLNGNLTNDGTNTYTWDARNRLVSIGGGTAASVQYDPLGRRTRKTINGVETGFFYDGLNPVQELKGSSVIASLLTSLGIDEYLSRTDSSGASHFLTDAVGSTIALTDAAGSPSTSYVYAPFGSTTLNGSPTGNAFDYTGREDDGTGLKYYRARYYHPVRQRFVSEDPIGLRGGVNLYSYAFNTPLNWTDPTGLDVYIARYRCCLAANHIGIAVNSHDTVGLYSTIDNHRALTGAPAEVVPDWQYHAEGSLHRELIRIPTTPQQDAAIQAFIDRARQNPGTYTLGGRNCGTFVRDALAAGNIPTRETIRPNILWADLLRRFGPIVPAAPHYDFP